MLWRLELQRRSPLEFQEQNRGYTFADLANVRITRVLSSYLS